MIKSSILTFLFLSVILNTGKAQTFWSESFNHNCASKCKPDTYTGPNGVWTVSPALSTEGSDPNDWFISYAEEGEPAGNCQGEFTKKNSCLHIGTSADLGATYKKGTTGSTERRVMSPTINCSGKSNITLKFDLISNIDTTNKTPLDYCALEYSGDNGASWTVLIPRLHVLFPCSAPKVLWRLLETQLPASANNNANVKIGFHWKNSDATGYDVSFAADSIRLSSVTPLSTGVIPGGPFCACSSINVPYDGRGSVFNTGNIFTAQLSDASGSFASPLIIGKETTTADTGRVKAVIPCNIPPGTGYKIRVVSSNTAITGTDVSIVISAPLKVAVTSNPDTICRGQKLVLKPTGGDPGKYEWWNGTIPPTVPVIKADSLVIGPWKDTSLVVIGRKGSCFDSDTIRIKVDVPPVVKVMDDTTCVGLPAILVASGGGTYLWNTGSTNDTLFLPNQTKDTSYVVTVRKGKCSVKATGYVKVFQAIDVKVNSPSSCGGQPVTLVATGALSYSWSTGQQGSTIVVSPMVTTTYTVTGTAGACKGEAVATVSVKPKPDVKVATPASVCQGSSVTLTATGAVKYFWLIPTNDTTATVTVKPAFSTTIIVVGVSADGCIDSADVFVKIDQRPVVTVNNPIICQGGTAVITANGATTYLWPATGDTTRTVSINNLMADAMIKVYGFNGACSDTAFSFVTVGVPVPVVLTGKNEIYSCESTQLFANPTDGT